jgi:WD40 repeat protein
MGKMGDLIEGHRLRLMIASLIYLYVEPATCAFVCGSRDHPIQLWDAYTGQLRGSYTAFSGGDVVSAPNSIAFSLDGSYIYAGFENHIQIFDVTQPGSEATMFRTTSARKSRDGQKGIISHIAFDPTGSGLLATASFSQSVGLFDTMSGEIVDIIKGKVGGMTQVCVLVTSGQA